MTQDNKNGPDKAFILAAGMGTRLRPHTDTIPKPMVEIAGQSIIRRTIDKLGQQGVKEIVVNTHHLAPVLEKHLKDISSPKIIISHEEELLDTGGGLKKALHHFGDNPYYIINGDALWDDKTPNALQRLADAWDASKMDILLLLQSVATMSVTHGVGDYHLQADGKVKRARKRDAAFMFAGVRIAHPRIFKDSAEGPFSFLSMMDKAETENKLYAIQHDDAWYHISTPEDLAAVDKLFKERL